MDPKVAQVLPAVNGNVHDLHQTDDTSKQERYADLHIALTIVHEMHVLSHKMPDLLNPLA